MLVNSKKTLHERTCEICGKEFYPRSCLVTCTRDGEPFYQTNEKQARNKLQKKFLPNETLGKTLPLGC